MRLLNTQTYRLEEFINDVPIYAILSHTWGRNEVTFQDIQNLVVAKAKAGWSKIENACAYVQKYKYDWIWIDTCCIDKSSSAELSEALNSMYRYYEEAHVCIAYLSDVSHVTDVKDLEELKRSRWFKRGWTLQELIAPLRILFLDQNWNMIGTRFRMRHVISAATSIPVDVFERGLLVKYSIAQKMSWAASRETTRPEDIAYCLMGLFGVSMPTIYGEGSDKAFVRLQQEIVKYSDDRSIFAWVATHDYRRYRGLFASSPSEFAFTGGVGISEDLGDKSSFSFGNNGLRIHLPLRRQQRSSPDIGEDIFVASLHCQDADGFIGIYLQKRDHHYIRWCPHFPLPRINDAWTASSLQEVVVKESEVFRRWAEQNYEIPIEPKLDSELTLLGEVDRDDSKSHTSTLTIMSLLGHPSRIIRLQTEKGQQVHFDLVPSIQEIIPWVVVVRLSTGSFCIGYRLQDSDLLRIDDENALISILLHPTGDSSHQIIAELNYIPSCSANFELYRHLEEFSSPRSALRSTSRFLNFMVDDLSYCYDFAGHSSVPLWQEGERKYGSISYSREQRDICCVVMYRLPAVYTRKFLLIALGLHHELEHCIPWIDIFALDEKLPISDVQQSYYPSGSRYGRRQDGRAMVALDDSTSIIVTLEEKTSFGSVIYHISITESEGGGLQRFNLGRKVGRLIHNVKGRGKRIRSWCIEH